MPADADTTAPSAPVTPDPLERSRARFDVWNNEGLERFAELFWDEDIVWFEGDLFPDFGTHRGREACVQRMNQRFEVLGHVQIEVVDAAVHGNRRYAELLVKGRGAASGAPVSMREFLVSEMREGGNEVLRMYEFSDRDEALAVLRDGPGRTS